MGPSIYSTKLMLLLVDPFLCITFCASSTSTKPATLSVLRLSLLLLLIVVDVCKRGERPVCIVFVFSSSFDGDDWCS